MHCFVYVVNYGKFDGYAQNGVEDFCQISVGSSVCLTTLKSRGQAYGELSTGYICSLATQKKKRSDVESM